MPNMDDISRKAQAFLASNKDKVQEQLKSEKAEGISDNILDKVAGAAKKVSKGKYDDKIDNARAQADKHIGNE